MGKLVLMLVLLACCVMTHGQQQPGKAQADRPKQRLIHHAHPSDPLGDTQFCTPRAGIINDFSFIRNNWLLCYNAQCRL